MKTSNLIHDEQLDKFKYTKILKVIPYFDDRFIIIHITTKEYGLGQTKKIDGEIVIELEIKYYKDFKDKKIKKGSINIDSLSRTGSEAFNYELNRKILTIYIGQHHILPDPIYGMKYNPKTTIFEFNLSSCQLTNERKIEDKPDIIEDYACLRLSNNVFIQVVSNDPNFIPGCLTIKQCEEGVYLDKDSSLKWEDIKVKMWKTEPLYDFSEFDLSVVETLKSNSIVCGIGSISLMYNPIQKHVYLFSRELDELHILEVKNGLNREYKLSILKSLEKIYDYSSIYERFIRFSINYDYLMITSYKSQEIKFFDTRTYNQQYQFSIEYDYKTPPYPTITSMDVSQKQENIIVQTTLNQIQVYKIPKLLLENDFKYWLHFIKEAIEKISIGINDIKTIEDTSTNAKIMNQILFLERYKDMSYDNCILQTSMLLNHNHKTEKNNIYNLLNVLKNKEFYTSNLKELLSRNEEKNRQSENMDLIEDNNVEKFVSDVKNKICCHKKLIDKMVGWRNARVAHFDMDNFPYKPKIKEVEDLKEVLIEIYNLFRTKLLGINEYVFAKKYYCNVASIIKVLELNYDIFKKFEDDLNDRNT